MANNKHNVTITNTMLVYPKSNPPQHILQLSNVDRKCPALMYLVLFYRNNPDKQDFCEGLKKGLEEILSVWYPAAGRLIMCVEPGEKSCRLEIACSNVSKSDSISGCGVLFKEAVTNAHISELGDVSQDNHCFFEKLVFRPSCSPDGLSEMPLVVAQVTEFGCGGYALGVGTNHSLFDGQANFNFMSAWASKTAGRQGDEEKSELFQPLHERGRLLLTDSLYNDDNDELRSTSSNVLAFTHLHQIIQQGVTNLKQGISDKLGIAVSDEEEFVLRTFTISNEKIQKLKSKTNISSCTSFEVVSAHLWKAKTRAIGVPKDRTACLQFSVEIRNRLTPPLPSSFTGNAYVLSSISSTCEDILEKETLSSIVHKIKAAKDLVTSDYVRAYILALNGPQDYSSLPPLPELTVVSDWRRTPYHKLDFGLGDALGAVPLAAPLPEVVYFMQSSREVGAIDVRIGLMRKHVAEFVHYFLDVF